MEQGEAAQKEVKAADAEAAEAKKIMESEVATLDERAINLEKELSEI